MPPDINSESFQCCLDAWDKVEGQGFTDRCLQDFMFNIAPGKTCNPVTLIQTYFKPHDKKLLKQMNDLFGCIFTKTKTPLEIW
ncbi:hypothetical protein CI610_02390 [invertebrate metagenome]|uniref:Uncharacterized protein n=1 Tax=invertebrate metagenome TaxID=1711999 RepID=A0A2H9T633_9ZZZZ